MGAAGGNTYFMMKLGACTGFGLYHIGAQMRGALSPRVRRVHRSYYAPMTTGMGVLALEDAGNQTAPYRESP
jgi:hypothetical protein